MRIPALLCWLAAAFTIAEAKPPNILFIVTDDQRPDTIHALGNVIIQTPNLDRLVARGSVFTRAVAAYPICHVSRAEMTTGCSAFRAYLRYPKPPIDPKLATFAGTFQKAGYLTCFTGKWHLDGQPKTRGYTMTSGLFSSGGAKGQKGAELDSQGHAVTGYTGWTFKTDDGKVELNKGIGLTPRTSEHVADGAISFLRQKHDHSFLLHVNFTAPHDPRMMPPGYEGRYDPQIIPLPKNFAKQHPFDHGNIDGRDEVLLKKPLDEANVRRELACYYALITHLDEQIGRVLTALDASGATEDTLVIFTTDQGLAMSSHGLMGKQNLYEHTLSVPLIIAGPKVPAGKRFNAQCYLRDIFPTACDFASISTPPTVEGRSLAPILEGKSQALYPFVVGYFTDTQRAIRDERWKLIRYPKASRTQLFDLQNDPHELHDLSEDAASKATRDELSAQLAAWLREHGEG